MKPDDLTDLLPTIRSLLQAHSCKMLEPEDGPHIYVRIKLMVGG